MEGGNDGRMEGWTDQVLELDTGGAVLLGPALRETLTLTKTKFTVPCSGRLL